jgi:hypothetical protein
LLWRSAEQTKPQSCGAQLARRRILVDSAAALFDFASAKAARA